MDFRQLQYVLTISQEHTLKAAAEALFLSPSALSQHISKLEQSLHTPLFDRTKQGWIPTHAGQIYIDMATRILDIQKKAYVQISDITNNAASFFVVGVTPGRGTQMFSQIYPVFKKQYPGVSVGLVEGTVSEIYQQIEAKKIDIGFISGSLESPEIVTIPQTTEEILLMVPNSHPLSDLSRTAPKGDYATVDLKLFAEDEFLLAGEGTTLRTLSDALFAQAGFTPKITFETLSLQTLNTLAKSGYGISFHPRFYADKLDNVVYFHTQPSATWTLQAAHGKGHYITKAEQYMIDLATEFYLTNGKA